MGVVGLRLNDFCHLTPNEWQAVAEAHTTHAEQCMHDDWERMRLLATISIQPHVKNKVTPTRLLPLPWDNATTTTHETAPAPQLLKEKARARFFGFGQEGGGALNGMRPTAYIIYAEAHTLVNATNGL